MASTPSAMLALGTDAPDFSLTETVSGRTVSLADFNIKWRSPTQNQGIFVIQSEMSWMASELSTVVASGGMWFDPSCERRM